MLVHFKGVTSHVVNSQQISQTELRWQVNELRGGDMEFLINCNIPFPLWSRFMVWFGLHLRPYDPLCILNLLRQWTYSSPLKRFRKWKYFKEKGFNFLTNILSRRQKTGRSYEPLIYNNFSKQMKNTNSWKHYEVYHFAALSTVVYEINML